MTILIALLVIPFHLGERVCDTKMAILGYSIPSSQKKRRPFRRPFLIRGCPGQALSTTISRCSRTPRRAATRIALHAGAIAHQREIPALAAHLAFVAFGFRLGAALGLDGGGFAGAACSAPLQGLELLRGRKIVAHFLLQRDRALDGVGYAGLRAVRGE